MPLLQLKQEASDNARIKTQIFLSKLLQNQRIKDCFRTIKHLTIDKKVIKIRSRGHFGFRNQTIKSFLMKKISLKSLF